MSTPNLSTASPTSNDAATTNTTSPPQRYRSSRIVFVLVIPVTVAILIGIPFGMFFGIFVGVSSTVSVAVIFLVVAFFRMSRIKETKRKDLESIDVRRLSLSAAPPSDYVDGIAPTQPMLLCASAGRLCLPVDDSADEFRSSGPRKYSYKELQVATNNFSLSELLGAGGFGAVYRGFLAADSTHVAVKCVAENSNQGAKEFKAEVTIISDLRHRNLVRLRGWCHEQDKFLVVYDYMPNGSLDRLLFNDLLCRKLNWDRRYSIALGLGSALLYLHEECDKVIIHRDIKSSNLLLDENLNAKLGDFGLSRQVDQGVTSHTTSIVAGTRGYMAPECFLGNGKATRETDVFAFGAVLLELASGKHIIDPSLTEDHQGLLVDWVWHLHSQGKVMEAMDMRLEGKYEEEEARRVLLVGLVCCSPDPKARPKIMPALDTLRRTVDVPTVPLYKPSFLFGPAPSMSYSIN